MNKRVLLISYHFSPQNVIGAVRPTKLAKYLTRMGYDVTVVCGKGLGVMRDPLLARDLAELTDLHVVRERSLLRWWKERGEPTETVRTLTDRPILPEKALTDEAMRKQAEASHARAQAGASNPVQPRASWAARCKHAALNTLYLWLYDCADRAFAREAFRTLYGLGRHFDVVLSTYGPLSCHTVARKAKRWKMADRWIADFRDEAAVPFPWQRGRLRRYVQSVRCNADAITSISEGCLTVMGLAPFGKVIHNGFDTEDLVGLPVPEKHRDRLTFIHCGQMYGEQRDLRPFFAALRDLAQEGAVDLQKIALAYAGRDTGAFARQAAEAGLADCLKNYGALRRDEAIQLQRSAHVLLLAAWNDRARQGNLPGKFLEYLLLNMPVLCCVKGDLPDSEIAQIIRRTNVGVCYEQTHAREDGEALRAYLRTLYAAFERGEPIPFAPDTQAVAAFASAGVAQAFADLIESV